MEPDDLAFAGVVRQAELVLVGRHGAEATLLALGAQLEERPGWPARHPAVATSA